MPTQLTATDIRFKYIRLTAGGEDDYTLVIKGTTIMTDGSSQEIEINDKITVLFSESTGVEKGIMSALVNLAETKLRQQANLE